MTTVGRMLLNGLGRSSRKANSLYIVLLALFICGHTNATLLENADVWGRKIAYDVPPQVSAAQLSQVPLGPYISSFSPSYGPQLQDAWQMLQFQPSPYPPVYPYGHPQTYPITHPQPPYNPFIPPHFFPQWIRSPVTQTSFPTQMFSAQIQTRPQPIINSLHKQILSSFIPPQYFPPRMYTPPTKFPQTYQFPSTFKPYQPQYIQKMAQQVQYPEKWPQLQYSLKQRQRPLNLQEIPQLQLYQRGKPQLRSPTFPIRRVHVRAHSPTPFPPPLRIRRPRVRKATQVEIHRLETIPRRKAAKVRAKDSCQRNNQGRQCGRKHKKQTPRKPEAIQSMFYKVKFDGESRKKHTKEGRNENLQSGGPSKTFSGSVDVKIKPTKISRKKNIGSVGEIQTSQALPNPKATGSVDVKIKPAKISDGKEEEENTTTPKAKPSLPARKNS